MVRSLTLYDLYHEPVTSPRVENHPVKVTVPVERYRQALAEARRYCG